MPRPDLIQRVGSFLIVLNVVLQILDGVSTQIGIRFYGLVESNSTPLFILNRIGLLGLVLEKVVLVAIFLAIYKIFSTRWEKMKTSQWLFWLLIFAAVAALFLFWVILNFAWILAEIVK